MKKIVALFLVTVILMTVIACNDNNNDISDTTANDVTNEIVLPEESEMPSETSEEAVGIEKEIFRAGYSIKNITPQGDIQLNTGVLMTDVLDPLYATCIAVYDGETTVLIYTVDVKNIGAAPSTLLRNRISMEVGVPAENIMISTTHNHSAPTPGAPASDIANNIWTLNVLHKQMIEAGKQAIEDLADAEMYVGTAKTTGMAFVRRYLLADGTYTGIHNGNKSTAAIVDYESEADDTVQIVRFGTAHFENTKRL